MNLPKRPKPHIANTKAIKRLNNLLPDEWVVREINPDYGIDFEIEIWEDNAPQGQISYSPSGRVCYVQLKNQENFSYWEYGNSYSKLQINLSTINYLYQKPNSFIIVNIKNDHFSILRIKELKEILIDKILMPKGTKVTIPISYKRPFLSLNYMYWMEQSATWLRIYGLKFYRNAE